MWTPKPACCVQFGMHIHKRMLHRLLKQTNYTSSIPQCICTVWCWIRNFKVVHSKTEITVTVYCDRNGYLFGLRWASRIQASQYSALHAISSAKADNICHLFGGYERGSVTPGPTKGACVWNHDSSRVEKKSTIELWLNWIYWEAAARERKLLKMSHPSCVSTRHHR